jgi:hypothetical protein
VDHTTEVGELRAPCCGLHAILLHAFWRGRSEKKLINPAVLTLNLWTSGFDLRNMLRRLNKCSSLDVVDCQRPEVGTLGGGRRKRQFRSPFSQLHHGRAVFLRVIYDR